MLVEDDLKIARIIQDGLVSSGFAVEHFVHGAEALVALQSKIFDVAILDVMLPDIDGIAVLKTIREKGFSFPVLILSAKREIDDRLAGFQEGCDDYLVKPFAFAELLARITALLRRSRGIVQPSELTCADLKVDILTRSVFRNGARIDLQPKEFDLLRVLLENAGQIVTRAMVLKQVWNYNFDPGTNVVDVRICSLREKIDKGHRIKLIHTIRGAGYVAKELA